MTLGAEKEPYDARTKPNCEVFGTQILEADWIIGALDATSGRGTSETASAISIPLTGLHGPVILPLNQRHSHSPTRFVPNQQLQQLPGCCCGLSLSLDSGCPPTSTVISASGIAILKKMPFPDEISSFFHPSRMGPFPSTLETPVTD